MFIKNIFCSQILIWTAEHDPNGFSSWCIKKSEKKEEINLINLHDLDPDPDPDQFISSADSLSASKLNGS